MKKQATQDVKNIYYALATIADDGVVTYAAPKKLFDLQKIKLAVSTSTDKFYTSDGIDIINNFEGGSLDLDTYGIDDAALFELEGTEPDTNGVYTSKSNDDPPYVAIGYEMEKRNDKCKFVWLLLCKKKISGDEGEVKGDKISPKGSVLPFDVIERADKQWKHTISEDDTNAPADLREKWFKEVYNGEWAA